jgi:hypothetical protein
VSEGKGRREGITAIAGKEEGQNWIAIEAWLSFHCGRQHLYSAARWSFHLSSSHLRDRAEFSSLLRDRENSSG